LASNPDEIIVCEAVSPKHVPDWWVVFCGLEMDTPASLLLDTTNNLSHKNPQKVENKIKIAWSYNTLKEKLSSSPASIHCTDSFVCFVLSRQK